MFDDLGFRSHGQVKLEREEGEPNGLNPHQNPKFWGCYLFFFLTFYFFYSSAISWVIISHQRITEMIPLPIPSSHYLFRDFSA